MLQFSSCFHLDLHDSYILVKKTNPCTLSPGELPPGSQSRLCLLQTMMTMKNLFQYPHETISKPFYQHLTYNIQFPQGWACHALMFNWLVIFSVVFWSWPERKYKAHTAIMLHHYLWKKTNAIIFFHSKINWNLQDIKLLKSCQSLFRLKSVKQYPQSIMPTIWQLLSQVLCTPFPWVSFFSFYSWEN